jgi:hypothetical protein
MKEQKRLPLCGALGKMSALLRRVDKECEWDDGCISIVSRA